MKKLKIGFGRVEHIVGKGENACYQHFLLFLEGVSKPSISGSLKVWIVWERVNLWYQLVKTVYSL